MLRPSLPRLVFPTLLVIAAAGLVRDARAAGGPVIPPGREPLVLQMLCERPGAPLPLGCTCNGVSIDHTFIRAKYACADSGVAIVELRHKQDGAGARDETTHFAIVPRGAPPAELVRDLGARVRAAEGAWSWTQATGGGGEGGRDDGRSGRFPLIVSLLAVAALSVAWWAESTPPRRET